MSLKRIFFILTVIITLFGIQIKVNANGYSYCVMERSSKRVLYSLKKDDKSLVASTAKIMTALVTINNSDIFGEVEITKEDVYMEGSKIYVEEGDKLQTIDLLYGLMLRSGNDAANALARTAVNHNYDDFIMEMNETAKRLNMYNSTFANPSGLDSVTKNYSTAYDMCLLMNEAMNYDIFREISQTKIYHCKSAKNINYSWHNKHKLVTGSSNFIAGKTGYTVLAKRILVSVGVIDDMEVIIVTINDSNDWNSHRNFLKQCQNYSFTRVYKKGVYDSGFSDLDYYIYLEKDLIVPLRKEEENDLSIEFQLNKKGGEFKVYIKKDLIISSPIKTIKKNYFDSSIIENILIGSKKKS